MANRNTLWAELLVTELARAGLKHVCLAPGSRSTPLVLAFAAQPELTLYTHLDERSAAFFALGLARASGSPVALLCTSGTAAANFYPAVVEAHQAAIPLIVLTADRPFELRDSGANQSINQLKMYGSFALWAVDVTVPEAQPSAQLIRSLRTLAARAYAVANGIRPGVVQLNMPFRKPLEPSPVATDVLDLPGGSLARADAFTTINRVTPRLTDAQVQELAEAVSPCKNGVIICGVDCPRDLDFRQALGELARQTGFPIFADATSGIRFTGLEVLAGFDSYVSQPHLPKADCILHFGRAPTSVALQHYVLSCDASEHWHIAATGIWSDEQHTLNRFIQSDEAAFCRALSGSLAQRNYRAEGALKAALEHLEATTWTFWQRQLPEQYFDGAVAFELVQQLPDNSVLFVANSLAVRHLEQFGVAKNSVAAYANRGASGIDGNVSTALGLGAATDKPLYLLIGDLTLYHDMNGLWGLRYLNRDVTLVLLNNQGGGIFRRLPVAHYEPDFSQYFLTPSELDFKHVAALYELDYYKVSSLAGFRTALAAPAARKLIDVQTDSTQDAALRQDLLEQYQTYLKELL